jgi:preprotein translocase subunit SecF
MPIVTHRRLFFWLAGLIVGVSTAAIAVFGLPLSIDFTGGSLVEVRYEEGRPDVVEVTTRIEQVALGGVSVRESGEANIIVRTRTLTPDEHQLLVSAMSRGGEDSVTELRFTSIGPAMGSELATKTLYALLGVTLAIMVYVAWAFRRVSRPVPSWAYGLVVVVVLLHDILVAAGAYAVLAHVTGAQVDVLFAVALLAILGYSVNDTIVIFDRVRENLNTNQHREREEPFAQVVGRSIVETLGRSINTSVTVALALLALIIFGSAETLNFAIVLFVGVIAGTYSSILIAAPLLVPLGEYFEKRRPVEDQD